MNRRQFFNRLGQIILASAGTYLVRAVPVRPQRQMQEVPRRQMPARMMASACRDYRLMGDGAAVLFEGRIPGA